MTKIRISLKPTGYTWVMTPNESKYITRQLHSFKGHTTDLAEVVVRLEDDLARAKTRRADATVRKLTSMIAFIRN